MSPHAHRPPTGPSLKEPIKVTVDAPSFKVDSKAYTSYSKYLDKEIEAANKCNAETVYDLQSASPRIANNLLENSNYQQSGTCSIKLNGDANDSESVSNLSWGPHTVNASYTFDNTTCSSDHILHITGLPYSAIPTKDNTTKSWKEITDGVNGSIDYSWNSDHVWFSDQTSSGDACLRIESPTFHLPVEEIPVNITVSAKGRMVWPATYNVDVRVYTKSDSYRGFTANYNSGNYWDYSINDLSLYKSFSKIHIENREHTALNRLHINRVDISYR